MLFYDKQGLWIAKDQGHYQYTCTFIDHKHSIIPKLLPLLACSMEKAFCAFLCCKLRPGNEATVGRSL